jgi:hypothetical protein
MHILAIRGKNLASLAEPFEILLNDGPLQPAGLFAACPAVKVFWYLWRWP